MGAVSFTAIALLAGVATPTASALEVDTTRVSAPQAAFAGPLQSARSAGSVVVTLGLRTEVQTGASWGPAEAAALQARITQARERLLATLDRGAYKVRQTYSLLPYVTLELSPSGLAELRSSGAASSVHPVRHLEAQATDQNGVIEATTQVVRGNAGSGQVVAVIDNGFDFDHPFIAGSAAGDEACFSYMSRCVDASNNPTTEAHGPGAAYSDVPHGTSVAGIVTGARFSGHSLFPDSTLEGVAPAASVLPVRVPGHISDATSPDVLASLNHVIEQKAEGLNVVAVNISQGVDNQPSTATDCDTGAGNQVDELVAPIALLRSLGVPTIVAAGNNKIPSTYGTASNKMYYPACLSGVISVGSTDLSTTPGVETVAGHSYSSPQIELLAPGTDLKLASPLHSSGFYVSAGTSFAAPAVAAAWAQYLKRYPGSSVDEVLAAFQSTGKPITDTRNGVTKPRINLSAAVSRWGFVVADSPSTASYTPPAAQQGNSMGGTNTVNRTATGTYTVQLPKLGSALQGNIHVNEFGTTANRCVSAGFGSAVPSTTTARVSVKCFTPAGAAADTKFVVQYQVKEQKGSAKRGYLVSPGSTNAVYDVSPDRMASNTAASDYYIERIAAGRYVAQFTDFTNSSGTPQVTEISGSAADCWITSWAGSAVGVACRNASGALVDTAFSLSFNDGSVVTDRRGAYLYANNPTSTSAYTPGADSAWNSQSGATTSRKIATGTYEVVLGGLGAGNAAPLVSAVGTSSAQMACRPESWSGTTNTTVVVKCTNAAGAATDSKFTLSFATSVPL